VLVIAMGLGLFAPPLGLGLYGACLIGNVPIEQTVKPIMGYLGLLFLCLLVIASCRASLPPCRAPLAISAPTHKSNLTGTALLGVRCATMATNFCSATDVIGKCQQVWHIISSNLHGELMRAVEAIVDPTFFGELIEHPSVAKRRRLPSRTLRP
jgi:hypothetical protein